MGIFQTIKTLAFGSQAESQLAVRPTHEAPQSVGMTRGAWKVPQADFHQRGKWRVAVADLTPAAR